MTGSHQGQPAGGAPAAGPTGTPRSGTVEPRFDELIHAPTRLSIVALLAAADWADFKFIRDTLGLSDSALSKQLSALEEAGYVEVRKGYAGKRPRTSVKLSRHGRDAFTRHVAALQQIVGPAGVSVLP
jgi:DNA-binding MarR family transcriptional regulator